MLTSCSGSTTPTNFNNLEGNGTIERTGGSTSSTSNSRPLAVADEVITDTINPISINILANDFGLKDPPINIHVSSLPDYGNITVNSDQTVTFTPNSNYIGQDTFTYSVTDGDGESSTAIVSLDIRCNGCGDAGGRLLSWQYNPDQVEGYIIYYGPSKLTANIEIAETSNSSIYISNSLINIANGDNVCFRLKAYYQNHTSDFSEAFCISA